MNRNLKHQMGLSRIYSETQQGGVTVSALTTRGELDLQHWMVTDRPWQHLFRSLRELRTMLIHLQRHSIKTKFFADGFAYRWKISERRLMSLMRWGKDFESLQSKLVSGRKYHQQGEIGAALWEVMQANRRAIMVHHLSDSESSD